MSEGSSSAPRLGGANMDEGLLAGVLGWLIGRRRQSHAENLRDRLQELIEEHEGATPGASAAERTLIENILALRDLSVGDVMVPRVDIVAVPEDIGLPDLAKRMAEVAHSRLPVYRETLDDVVGFVHIKDLMAYWGAKNPPPIKQLVRKAIFTTASMRAYDLLLQMREQRIHLALVVDEFGGIDGLLTIEDLVEQIVGEIADEHDDVEAPLLCEREDGTLMVDARASVEDFEAKVGPVLTSDEREDAETVGGLVFYLAGRVPARGEVIRHASGIAFEVTDADRRRVKRLIVRDLPPAAAQAGK